MNQVFINNLVKLDNKILIRGYSCLIRLPGSGDGIIMRLAPTLTWGIVNGYPPTQDRRLKLWVKSLLAGIYYKRPVIKQLPAFVNKTIW